MKIESFKITNARSIVDSGWCKFSPDGVTVLVGQNESGKSSILEALHNTFSSADLSNEGTRYDQPLPKTYMRVRLEQDEVEALTEGLSPSVAAAMLEYTQQHERALEIAFGWEKAPAGSKNEFTGTVDIEDKALADALHQAHATDYPDESPQVTKEFKTADLASLIHQAGPRITLFSQNLGDLPNSIDIPADLKLAGPGSTAARNFLSVAGIDLNYIINADLRSRENHLARAKAKITEEFKKFWTQHIGKDRRLTLECRFETHSPSTSPAKLGLHFLTFWINDELTQLYPRQRSAGVRWFVSFFLQLKATERAGTKRIFLLDEPGANLHSRAQEDVLKLINELSRSIPIIYSTHSQDMIEFEKLYRIRAVQRDGDGEDSPTRIYEAEHLAAASSDTLSPVLGAIGASMWRQQVIPRRGSVLLEEISGQYYLQAFWKLTGCPTIAHFIPATGANKVPQLAYMLQGWGLDFAVVVDDDSRGRGVFNELKRDLFADDEARARSRMLKIRDCDGIEDLFSKNDFKKYISPDFDPTGRQSSPAAWMKAASKSKPLLAYNFLARVNEGEIRLADLEEDTRSKIEELVASITALSPIAPVQ